MRLIYHPDGSPDCPLLVVSEFTPADVAALHGAARDLAMGVRSWARFDQHIQVSCPTRLLFRVGAKDTGILATPPKFECILTRLTWSQVEGAA